MANRSKNTNSSYPDYTRSADDMSGSVDRRNYGPSAQDVDDMTIGDYMTGMPTIRISTLLRGFIKQSLWVIPLLLLGVFIIHYFTKDIKRSYVGEGSLLVQIGPEYIYTPIGTSNSNNQGGISQTPDTIALNEVGIMKNSEIIDQVIGIMTSPRDGLTERQAQDLFAQRAFKKIRAAERSGSKRQIEDAYAELHEEIENAYIVSPRPKASLIDVAFKHENPEIAVETVNQFIDAYKNYRRTVFVEGTEDTISERRDETEKQLKDNERKIARFLERNDVSDFTSEQTGLRDRSETLKTELNTLRALMSETEGSLATVEDQLRNTNPEINLYVDDRTSQRVAQAELELKQLLAKYLPTSDPVSQKRTEIAELRSLQAASNGQAAGGRRVGPNPVYQSLLTRRNNLQSSADSYREKEFVLQRQLDSAVAKVRRLTKISPEHQNLLRERKTLSDALDTYNARAQEAAVNLAQAEANNENIKVISYATFAFKGKNLGKLLWAGGSLAWALTLVMLALLIVFLNPDNFKAPGSGQRGPRRRRTSDRESEIDSRIPEAVPPAASSPMPAAASAVAPAAASSLNYAPVQYAPVNAEYNAPQAYVPQAPIAQSNAYNPYLNTNPYLQAQAEPARPDQTSQYGAYEAPQSETIPVIGRFSGHQA